MTRPTPEQFAAQRAIKVQCRCGWQGMSDQLERKAINLPQMVCPKCYADFESWPSR